MIFLKIQWKKLIACLAIPLAVGGVAALLTRNSMQAFETLNKPPLSPPGWLFPVVWTILYILMGIASYLILREEKTQQTGTALVFYGAQLVFNFFWPIIFFNLEMYLFAFVWLVLLELLIVATAVLFYKITKPAGYLMIPYILWVAFAGYLNCAIYLLN